KTIFPQGQGSKVVEERRSQRGAGYVFSDARIGCLSTEAGHAMAQALSCRRLDGDRVALDDGRSSPQRQNGRGRRGGRSLQVYGSGDPGERIDALAWPVLGFWIHSIYLLGWRRLE